VGTAYDGDVIFAVSPTGVVDETLPLAHIESAAIAVVEQSIERGVRMAKGRDGFPGLADR
jgi:L-aminopeptidase/D-esterase-like protein